MLAMERLPLSQPPFSGHLSLSSPIMYSPRAGMPAPLIQGLPSPPALHSSHHHGSTPSKPRPSSSSSLSSAHTPPPYGDTTLMGSAGPPVYSPTNSSSLLPPSASGDLRDQLTCHRTGADHTRHSISMPMPPLSCAGLIGHQPMSIVSAAQETSCVSPGPGTRDHQASTPAGEFMHCDMHYYMAPTTE